MVTRRILSLLLVSSFMIGAVAACTDEQGGSEIGSSVGTTEVSSESCADENRVSDCTDEEILAELEAVEGALNGGYTEENYLLYLALADVLDELSEHPDYKHRHAVVQFKAKPRYEAPPHAPKTFSRTNIRLTLPGSNGAVRVELPRTQVQVGAPKTNSVKVLPLTPSSSSQPSTPPTKVDASRTQTAPHTPTQPRPVAPHTTSGNVTRGVLGSPTQTVQTRPTTIAPAPSTSTFRAPAPAPVTRSSSVSPSVQ